MKKRNTKLILLEVLLMISFFFALFASRIIARYAVAFILLAVFLILKKNYRIKSNEYIYEKQVNILMVLFAFIYIAIFYALGLHFGYITTLYPLSIKTFLTFILPFIIIIIFNEYVRKILLSQDIKITIRSRKINISVALTFIITVLVDLILYVGVYDLETLDNFLKVIGYVVFASISCNLLFQYLTPRFGPKGIIIYRLITVLFIYIIPFEPDVFILLRAFLRMVYPFIIYLILENTYAKANLALNYRQRKRNMWTTGITLILLALFVMLISCKFKYGIIVIGSKSMTGTVNMGDAVIYEKYDGGEIKQGQVVMFMDRKTRIIHRAIKVRNVDNEIRITTKGDANKSADEGYRTPNDVNGLVKLRVKYIGWPTIWVHRLFHGTP